eukprot:764706-Hanusia_phi.AAC.2
MVASRDECRLRALYSFLPSLGLSLVPWIYLLSHVPYRRGIPFNERASTYILQSRTGFAIEAISAVMSGASCVFYVISTYITYSDWSRSIDIAMSTYFGVYWVIYLYLSTQKLKYLSSLQSFVDIVTVFPVLLISALGHQCDESFGLFAAARVIRFFRVLRLIRLIRSFELISDASDDAIRRQTIRIISIVLCILVVTTGIVQYLANETGEVWTGVAQQCEFFSEAECSLSCPNNCELDSSKKGVYLCYLPFGQTQLGASHCQTRMMFHDSLYYTLVTFSTVGYGDVVPITAMSRILMLFMIGLTIYVVPNQFKKLHDLRELQSEFDSVWVKKNNRAHVILACNPSVDFHAFIAEFFHEDHALKTMFAPQLVILVDCPPSNEVRQVLLK